MLFFFTFALILLAELADKSQLVILTIVMQKGHALKVAIGASLGLITMTIIGILLGAIISIFIPIFFIQIVGGIVFIALGCYGLLKKQQEEEIELETNKIEKYGILFFSFVSLFFMELGDKTQVLAISLVAMFYAPIPVLLGTITALTLLTFLAAFAGLIIAKKIPKKTLNLVSSVLFVLIGIIIIFLVFIPS